MSDKSGWKVFLFLFSVNFLLRISTLFQQVVNIDEAHTAQFAWEMMAGHAPYTASFGDKPFLYYYFYYLALRLFGPFNLIGMHVATTLMVALTAAGLYGMVRHALDARRGLITAILFSCLTTMGEFKLVGSDGESLMNLPMVLAMFAFLIALEKDRWPWFLLTGFLIGLASQFRYQGGIQLAVVGSYFLLFDRRKLFSALPLILLGFLFCFAAVFAWLWSLGSWEPYAYWSWEYEVDYIRVGLETINPWKKGFIRTFLMIAAGFAVWLGAGRTVFRAWKEKGFLADPRTRRLFWIGLLWLVWGYAAVTTGGRFASRYFIQIFPPLALLAGMTFTFRSAWRRYLLLIPVAGFWAARFFSPQIHAAIGELDYAPFQKEIGSYIRERTEPKDRIYIWGWGNAMYVYAQRQPATRLINSDFLTGRIPGSPTAYDLNYDTSFNIISGSWEMLMEDFEKYRPAYIVDTAPANIHDYIKYPVEKFPWLKNYLDKHYRLEKTLYKVDLYRRVTRNTPAPSG